MKVPIGTDLAIYGEEDAKKQWKKKRTGALRLNAQLAPQLAALRTTERAKGAS